MELSFGGPVCSVGFVIISRNMGERLGSMPFLASGGEWWYMFCSEDLILPRCSGAYVIA